MECQSERRYTRASVGILALMVTIASIQVVMANNGLISRWKGGGFGMYTDPHPHANRQVWLHIQHPDGTMSFARLQPRSESSLSQFHIDDRSPFDAATKVDSLLRRAHRLRSRPNQVAAKQLASSCRTLGVNVHAIVISEVRYSLSDLTVKHVVIYDLDVSPAAGGDVK